MAPCISVTPAGRTKMTPMRTRIGAGLLVLLMGGPAFAKDRGFSELTRQVEQSYHVRRTRIPFLGVARFAAKSTSQFGGRTFDVAIFEDVPEHAGWASIQTPDGWTPVVLTQDGRERTMIFARPEERSVRILLLTEEPGEVTVVESEATGNDFLRHLTGDTSDGFHAAE